MTELTRGGGRGGFHRGGGMRGGRGGSGPGFRGGRGGSSPGFRGGRGGASPGFRGGRGGASPGFRGGRGGSSPGFRGRGGFRGGRGGRGGGQGAEGRKKLQPHRLEGIYIQKAKTDSLCTQSIAPGVKVYGEKRIVEEEEGVKMEYREWNPFRSKLAASIVNGIENIYIKPGSKVLYLGAASGTTVSHVSDIVGKNGMVYAVEFSERCGRDLITVAQRQHNIVPLIMDARMPYKYGTFIWGAVDVIFSDVAQPDQARILALNAEHFLKSGGHFLIAIKASCIDSSAPAEAVFTAEVAKLREEKLKPLEQVTLEPYERDHCVIAGIYRPDEVSEKQSKKRKQMEDGDNKDRQEQQQKKKRF